MVAAAGLSRRDLALRPLLFAGVAAPLLYAATVAWGATFFEGYSHLVDPISSLTESGREGAGGLESLFLIYNALVAVYAIGGISISLASRPWLLSFTALLVVSVAGLLMLRYPQDPIGAAATLAGTVHLVLAGMASVATMVAVGAGAYAWRGDGRATMTRFSLACLALIVLAGLATFVAIPAGWPLLGLLERITIGAFELWLTLTAAAVYLIKARA